MKPKQTLIFIFLNIIGYATLAFSIYYYLLENVLVASILLGLGVVFIFISFKVGLKVNTTEEGLLNDNSALLDEDNELDLVPISQFEPEEVILDEVVLEDSIEVQSSVFEDKSILEFLSHYSNYEENQDLNIIATRVDTIEILEINLKNLSDKMDTYGLIKKNPLFNYRFEAVLKQGVTDTKIWENLYENVPYIDIVEQYIDTMNRNVYLVRASINERTRSNIGYLPINLSLNLNEIFAIEGTLIGGRYNYLNNEDSSFNTLEQPLQLHLRIHTK